MAPMHRYAPDPAKRPPQYAYTNNHLRTGLRVQTPLGRYYVAVKLPMQQARRPQQPWRTVMQQARRPQQPWRRVMQRSRGPR